MPTSRTEPFGADHGHPEVELFTLGNAHGFEVAITNYGGIVTAIRVPDRDGRIDDIALGFDDLSGYLGDHPYFGALIGRYGNRIGAGRLTIDGADYHLATNNGANHLHGGERGFDKIVWAAQLQDGRLELTHVSPDGDEGYPGKLTLRVTYSISDAGELTIDYHATTDATTVVNLTNHTYFNLQGSERARDVLAHELTLRAGAFTPVDEELIPTGEIRDVEGSPFDFRSPRAIGARIDADDEQIRNGSGYDHNWVLDGAAGTMRDVARAYDPSSGRILEVATTEPGVQFYSGNFLDGTLVGKHGKPYGKRAGFCLETQHFPDSPNKAHFPTTTLEPGGEYRTTTVYRFSTDA